jgi:hypothetical protein
MSSAFTLASNRFIIPYAWANDPFLLQPDSGEKIYLYRIHMRHTASYTAHFRELYRTFSRMPLDAACAPLFVPRSSTCSSCIMLRLCLMPQSGTHARLLCVLFNRIVRRVCVKTQHRLHDRFLQTPYLSASTASVRRCHLTVSYRTHVGFATNFAKHNPQVHGHPKVRNTQILEERELRMRKLALSFVAALLLFATPTTVFAAGNRDDNGNTMRGNQIVNRLNADVNDATGRIEDDLRMNGNLTNRGTIDGNNVYRRYNTNWNNNMTTRTYDNGTMYRATAVNDNDTDWGWLGLLGLIGLAGLMGRGRERRDVK